MENSLEIKPLIGIGNLKFGATASEVTEYFGEADEVEDVDTDEEFKTIIWHYWDKGFSVFFEDNENLYFTSVEVDNVSSVMWNRTIFDMSEEELVDLFKANGYNEIDEEEHEWGEKRVSFDDAMVDMYFEDGLLTSISYGGFLNDSGIMEISIGLN